MVEQSLKSVGDVDNLCAVLEFDEACTAFVDLSRNCRYGDDVRTEILGSDGALFIDLLPTGRTRLGTNDGVVEVANSQVVDATTTNMTRLNLNAIAPARSHRSMTSLANGFTSVPPLRKMYHVNMMSMLANSKNQT